MLDALLINVCLLIFEYLALVDRRSPVNICGINEVLNRKCINKLVSVCIEVIIVNLFLGS